MPLKSFLGEWHLRRHSTHGGAAEVGEVMRFAVPGEPADFTAIIFEYDFTSNDPIFSIYWDGFSQSAGVANARHATGV